MYLIYDIKGIQHTIAAVPRLRCIVGASSLIAQFDSQLAPAIAKELKIDEDQCTCGGGKGTIEVPDEATALRLRDALIRTAHRYGLDIAIGCHEQPETAFQIADFFPFVPRRLRGVPCGKSGLYPVPGERLDQRPMHSVIRQRYHASSSSPELRQRFARGGTDVEPDGGELADPAAIRGDLVGLQLLERMAPMLAEIGIPKGAVRQLATRDGERWRLHCRFMRNVSDDGDERDADASDGFQGQAALSHRNRWALLVADGNDIGKQLNEARRRYGGKDGTDIAAYRARLRLISRTLHRLTLDSLAEALTQAIAGWVASFDGNWEDLIADGPQGPELVLPFRPLIAGGDDISVLAHPAHALNLAQDLVRAWQRGSAEARDEQGATLWPATGGRLTISCGLAFLSNRYPIASALDYAHHLLESAKHAWRGKDGEGQPSPAALDFETLTDGLLDTPAQRRARELEFCDSDLGGRLVRLTCRPYRCDQLPALQQLAKQLAATQARHALAEVQRALRLPYVQRLQVAWRMHKRHPLLAALLAGPALPGQPPPPPANDDTCALVQQCWDIPSGTKEAEQQPITTRLWDAILLVEETHRLSHATALA